MVLAVVLLAVLLAGILLLPATQTWLGRRVSGILAGDPGVVVRIERIVVRPFGGVRLHGVYIEDLHGDTLIAADDVLLTGLRPRPKARRLDATTVTLSGARFALDKRPGEKSNLTNWLDRLGPSGDTMDTRGWAIHFRSVTVNDLHFTYQNANEPEVANGVDLDHVDAHLIHLHATGLSIEGDSIEAGIHRLMLTERSGLKLLRFQGDVAVSPHGIAVRDLFIRTPDTGLKGQLAFRMEDYDDLDDFIRRVELRLDLDRSHVEMADIALFAPELTGVHFGLRLAGRFRGTIADLKGKDVQLDLGRRTTFRGDLEMSGLPQITSTFMVIDVDQLITDRADLMSFPVPPFSKGGRLELPADLRSLGEVRFRGNFTGFPNAFTAFGTTTTALGGLRTDISYERDTVHGDFHLAGRLATDGFDLGPIAGDRTVGPLACDVRVDATGHDLRSLRGDLEGTVPLLTLNGYGVSGIKVKGHLERNLFNGELQCRDEALRLDFRGLADLQSRMPMADFTARIDHADLRALGLIKGPGYSSVSMDVRAEGELVLDSLRGRLDLSDVIYCDVTGDHELGEFHLESRMHEGLPEMHLRSSILDADVRGKFLPTRLPSAFESVVYSVFPALRGQTRYQHDEQRFDFDLVLKEPDRVAPIIAPGLEISPGMTVQGFFDTRTFDLGINAAIPHIGYAGFSSDSMEIVADKTLDVLALRLTSGRQWLSDSTFLSDMRFTGKAYQDEVQLTLGWEGSSQGTRGALRLQGAVLGPRSVELDLLPSTLYFGRGEWRNDRPATLKWDSTVVQVRSLELFNGSQRVVLDGQVLGPTDLPLAFDLKDIRMENFASYIEGPPLHGRLSGDGRIFHPLDKPYLLSYLCIDSLAVGKEPVGDIRFAAAWNEGRKAVDLAGTVERDTLKALDFAGRFAPGKADGLNVQLSLDRFDLHFLEPYLPSGLSNIQGRVTGKVKVTGSLADPQLNGEAMMENAGLRINYLNTFYSFTNKVGIRPNMFTLDNVSLYDQEGHMARVGGTIVHHAFADWNFNVWGTMHGLLTLNTSVTDNEIYYGKAYAYGDIEVGGYADNLEVSLQARTGPGTVLHLPLGGSTEISDIGFVRFVRSGAAADSLTEELDLSGITLNMDVDVTPDARFELIFDPTVGDVLSGSGSGHIEMTVTPAGDLAMFGTVEVSDGEYLFTLRNLLNKRFQLEPGGTVTWYGDPLNATLDMNAVYKLRTALYDVMREKNDAYRKRVPVEVAMHLKDRLMNPAITFDVRLPTVDEGVRTEVNSVLSTEQEKNRQVFALIVLNKFMAPPELEAASSTSGSFASTTGSELLSNQVSNWLSRLSNDVDLGVNYRPGDDINQEEVALAVSTQLFNERLLVSTNVGLQYGGSAQQGNSFIGDFQAEYLLGSKGRLRLKGFSQSNDRNLNQADQAPTTQGFGLAYRREFDTLNEFFRNLFRKERTLEETGEEGDR